eukprot:scaffold23774_cov41-Attheya_sp.AAC.2
MKLVGRKFRKTILKAGDGVDPVEAFHNFRGRDIVTDRKTETIMLSLIKRHSQWVAQHGNKLRLRMTMFFVFNSPPPNPRIRRPSTEDGRTAKICGGHGGNDGKAQDGRPSTADAEVTEALQDTGAVEEEEAEAAVVAAHQTI